MQKALIMKKLSILALAATALLISGANGIAANNNLHSVITTTKKAAGDVHENSTTLNCYTQTGGWLGNGYGITLAISGVVGNGFGVFGGATYNNDVTLRLYDADGNLTVTETFEGYGNAMGVNRGKPANYKGYLMHVPAGLSVTFNGAWQGANDYDGEIWNFPNDQYYYCGLDENVAGEWTSVEMPSEVTVDSDNITLASGETHAIIASKVGGTDLLKYTYSTSDNTIASVSSDGTITANNAGTCTITVKYGVVTKQISLTVTGAAAVQTGIKIKTGKTIETTEGRGYSLSDLVAVKMYGDVEGDQIAITEDMISGTFNKNEVGEYALTLTSDGFSDTFTVKVTPIPVASMGELQEGYNFGNNSGWGSGFYFVTSLPDISHYVDLDAETIADVSKYIELNGAPTQFNGIKQLGGGRYEMYFADQNFKNGDILTLKEGLKMYHYSGTLNGHTPNGDGTFYPVGKLDKEYKFVFGNGWHVYVGEPSELTVDMTDTLIAIGEAQQITYTVGPEGTYGSPIFASENPSIATVSNTGLIEGVSVGSTKVTVTLGSVVKEITVNVTEAKTIKGVKITNVPNYYSIVVGSDPKQFKPEFKTAKLVFEDDTMSPEFSIDSEDYTIGEFSTETEGDIQIPVSVTAKGTKYDTTVAAKVYSYYDQEVYEVGVVDWFNYATFIRVDNTCTNTANITTSPLLKEQLSKIKYTRKDGTEVVLNGNYQLGANIALFPSFLYESEGHPAIDATNYNADGYYQVGDLITIEENCPVYKWTGDKAPTASDDNAIAEGTGEIIVEGYFKKTVQYKYNGSIWTSWIEYEDLVLSETSMELEVGKTAKVPASRTPDNATQGTFSYVSSDESIVTVTANGVIKAVKPGTATITVTLSDPDYPEKTKTATLTVTVSDKITGFALNSEETLKVNKGTSEEDLLKMLEATFTWASGKKEGAVDFSNATVKNYDKDTVGEQTIVVTVTVDGVKVNSNITIEVVKKSGCGGSIIATSAIISALGLAGLGVGLASKKRRRK